MDITKKDRENAKAYALASFENSNYQHVAYVTYLDTCKVKNDEITKIGQKTMVELLKIFGEEFANNVNSDEWYNAWIKKNHNTDPINNTSTAPINSEVRKWFVRNEAAKWWASLGNKDKDFYQREGRLNKNYTSLSTGEIEGLYVYFILDAQ